MLRAYSIKLRLYSKCLTKKVRSTASKAADIPHFSFGNMRNAGETDSELGNNRIVAGMHSPLDVIGGRSN